MAKDTKEKTPKFLLKIKDFFINHKKVIIGIIVGVVIIGAIAFCVTKLKDSNTNVKDIIGNICDKGDNSVSGSPEAFVASENKIEDSGYSVVVKQNSGWEDQGEFGYVYDVVITNTSDKLINGWELVLTFPNETQIKDLWCGNKDFNGKTLKITPMDYNKDILAKETITLGFTCSAKGKQSAEDINISYTVQGTSESNDNKR